MNDWMELMEYSRDGNCMINNVDKVTKICGPKPTPKQDSEMARHKDVTHQENREKQIVEAY